jgi:hypothetical protein
LLESDETEVRRLAEMDNGLRLLIEAGGLLTEWKPFVHTAKWTLQAKDGGVGQVLEDVAAARVGRGDAGANFVRRDDRRWLEAWYGTLLNAYVLPLRDEVHLQLNTDDTDGDALEDSMPVFLALTQATGHSAYQLLRARLSERESLSWTVTRQTMVSDYRTWIVATTATAGLLVFYLLWSLYLNLCRYRMVMHARFYRDEHLWLR